MPDQPKNSAEPGFVTTDDHAPLVSVVMTVWNGAQLVGESIQSILGQTFTDFELILIDDGSTDRTVEVAESFHDPRLRIWRREHRGIVDSANFGVSQSRGRFIARLDADDISLPDRLAKQVEALNRHPAAVLCYTDVEVFGDLAGLGKLTRFTADPGLIAMKMCFICSLTHSSVLYRREAFDRAGGYLESTPVAEDYSLYVRLNELGPFVGIAEKLVRYRRQNSGASGRHAEIMAELAKAISIQQTRRFLKVDAAQAEALSVNGRQAPGQRDLGLWLRFCLLSLRHPSTWRPEPMGWILLNTMRTILSLGGKAATERANAHA